MKLVGKREQGDPVPFTREETGEQQALVIAVARLVREGLDRKLGRVFSDGLIVYRLDKN
jgi:hypothetical protein